VNFDHQQDDTEEILELGAAGWRFVVGLVFLCIIAILSGCADYPITGSVVYRDPETGAKGGLVFRPGESPVGTVRVPIYDEETGELVAMADVEAPIIRSTK
jgi:hypothetical protein